MQVGRRLRGGIKLPALLAILCQLWPAVCSSHAETENLDFNLPKWGGNGERVKLDDFKGGIVVLDFFAYWCVPCQKASAQIESGIRQHYAKQGGNNNGVPVTVLGINIDDSKPDKVAQFVKNAGFESVLTDADGSVFKKYGGTGVPFVIIVDMAGATPAIIYKSAGFKGVEALRTAIDSVAAQPAQKAAATNPSVPAPVVPPTKPEEPAQPVPQQPDPASEPSKPDVSALPDRLTTHDLALNSALLDTSDIRLVDSVLEYNLRHPNCRVTASLLHGYIGMDFVPAGNEFFLEENRLDEQRFGLNLNTRIPVSDSLVWTLGGGAQQGFTDYKSLWLSEYYKQKYNFYQSLLPDLIGEYQEVDPWGYNCSTDLRWEFLPSCGFLTGSLSYQYDRISPAYLFILPNLERENSIFETISGSIGLENILTPRVRTQAEVRLRHTTGRKLRGSLKGAINYALAESLVWRTEASGTLEDPALRAWSVGMTLEKDWNNTWFVGLTGRYYEDTGEFEEALPGNATAPAVRTFQGLLSLRWQGKSSSLRISAGPYFNRYLEASGDPSFSPLYQDRDWLHVNLAYMWVF